MQMGRLPNPKGENRFSSKTIRQSQFELVLTLPGVSLDLLPSLLAELDAVGTVHLGRNDPDLLLQRLFQAVKELELRLSLTGLDDSLGESDGTLSTLGPVVGRNGIVGSVGERVVLDQLQLGRSVGTAGIKDG